jgi:hypothetical protein
MVEHSLDTRDLLIAADQHRTTGSGQVMHCSSISPHGSIRRRAPTVVGVFTYSPVGAVEPTGEHLEWEVIGTFRYDDVRLAEEWVQTDYRSFLTKLGVS